MKSEQDKYFLSHLAEEEKRRLNIQFLRIQLEEDAKLAGRTSTSDNAHVDDLWYVTDRDKAVLRVELDKSLRGRVGSFRRDWSAKRRTFFLYDTQDSDARLVMPPSLDEARIEVVLYEKNRQGWGPLLAKGSKWKVFADENRNSEIFKQGISYFTKLRNDAHKR